MNISFDRRVSLQTDVLISNVQNESVILNVNTERYFGLDEVGTRFLTLLSNSETIQKAYEALLDEYEVEPDALRTDMINLLTELVDQGLVKISSAE